jgi:hypothetical protein
MRQIREEIWDLLKSKGFKESAHGRKILKKDVEVTRTVDNSKIKLTIKYKFGKNNLYKFYGGLKKYSIPFKHIGIVDGRITRI